VTTFGDVINLTRRRLLNVARGEINVLAVAIDGDDTALTFTYPTHHSEGSRLSIGLEDMHTVAGPSTTTAAVIRALDGSVATSHSIGDIVRIDAPWTDFEIATAVNNELGAISGEGLFRIKSLDFIYNPTVSGYDLPASDLLDIWRVRYRTTGPDLGWPVIPPDGYRLDQVADTTDFSSGQQLVLRVAAEAGQPVRVSYRASFDSLVDLADDVTTVSGLHAEAHEILWVGAAIRLVSGLEVNRAIATAQGDPRRADEIEQRSTTAAITPLLAQREEILRREQARLLKRYPMALR
jgi:hypothetical protein